MQINSKSRLPPGKRIFFEETTSYKIGNVTAVVERVFAPAGSETLVDILEYLAKSTVLSK